MSFSSHELIQTSHTSKGILTRFLDRIIPPVKPEIFEVKTVGNFEEFLREAERIHATRLRAGLMRTDRVSQEGHILTHATRFTAIEGRETVLLEEGYEEGTVTGISQDAMGVAIARRQQWTAECRLDEALKLLPQAATAVSTSLLFEHGEIYGGEFLLDERQRFRNYAMQYKLEPLTPIQSTV